uniref:G-protein coupled receptors family 1 profile domain-containing protein n=1 Tax=Strongyloides stercoralis TaxID=6248 RepID=A0A0K0E7F3_STRER
MTRLNIYINAPTFIHYTLGYILSYVGLIVNIIVIIFTFKNNIANKNKEQRLITRISSATNISYAIINLIVHPQLEFVGDTILLRCYGYGMFATSSFLKMFFIYLFIYGYIIIFTCVSIGLLFRYHLLCRKVSLTKKQIIKQYVICFIYSVCTGVVYTFNFVPNVPLEFINKVNLNLTIWKNEDPSFWEHILIYRGNSILLYCSILLYISLIVGTYGFIIFSVYKMKTLLKTNRDCFSRKTLHLQRQFNRILDVQSITPIFLILLPIFFGVILVITKVRVNGFGLFIILGLESIPFINGLSVILLTKEYRIRKIFSNNTSLKSTTKVNSRPNKSTIF